MPAGDKLEALVASVLKDPPDVCWASRLTGDALEFVARLEAVEDANPRSVHRKDTAAVLYEEFGVETDAKGGQVSRHLRRECKCRPR